MLHRLKRSNSAGPPTLSPHSTSFMQAHFSMYKGKGKDPLISGSYRGITLTSVIAKPFEHLLLDRMLPVLVITVHPI